MNEGVQVKKMGSVNFLYVGDAIYLIDEKNLKCIKKNINKKNIRNLIKTGKIKVYSLWNLIYYDIIIIS